MASAEFDKSRDSTNFLLHALTLIKVGEWMCTFDGAEATGEVAKIRAELPRLYESLIALRDADLRNAREIA